MNEKIFEFEVIDGEPVYTLGECFAAAYSDNETSDDDCEYGSDPISQIKERFRKSIYFCNEEKLSFLRLAAELSEGKAAWEADVANYPSLRVLSRNDFVYLFKSGDIYYLVLPDELIEIFREVMADEDFPAVNAKNLELISYATALLDLCGAYEIQHFAAVWNHHHKDKITLQETENFLFDLAYFNLDYYFYDGYVVHDALDEDEFDELWEETYEMEYYMPAKSVIRECIAKRNDYGYKSPSEKQMHAYLAEYIKDERELDDVQFEIVNSCERLKTPAEVREILEDTGVPVDDAAFVEKFERLYNSLRNNTHIWELRGFTPYQYRNETGETIPYFRLPK